MVSLMVILFSTKCFLFVYMYIDLLKLKACKLFDADLSWLFFFFFFKEANLYFLTFVNYHQFILNQYQGVGQKPTHTNTLKMARNTVYQWFSFSHDVFNSFIFHGRSNWEFLWQMSRRDQKRHKKTHPPWATTDQKANWFK